MSMHCPDEFIIIISIKNNIYLLMKEYWKNVSRFATMFISGGLNCLSYLCVNMKWTATYLVIAVNLRIQYT